MKYLGLIAFLFFLGSCEKDYSIAPPSIEAKLITIWVFEDAASATSSSISSIYDNYKNDQLKLNEDGTLLYTEELGSGAARNGTWTLDRTEVVYDDVNGYDSVEVTDILNLSIGQSSNKEEYTWEVNLTENETLLVGKEFKNNRTYSYYLRKKY